MNPFVKKLLHQMDGESLDGTLYVDRSGKPWMVFCHEWLQVGDGQICAIPMSDDLGEAIGDPVIYLEHPMANGMLKAQKKAAM